MASIQADMPFHLIGGSLDDKQNFKTLEEMKNCPEDSLGKTAMCTNDEDGKMYVFNINNEVSEETGKWKVVEGNSTPSSLDDTDWVSTGLGIVTDSEKITINDISLKRVGDAVAFRIHGFMKTECSNTTVADIITNIPDKYRPNRVSLCGKIIEPIAKIIPPSAITLKPPNLSTKGPTISWVIA